MIQDIFLTYANNSLKENPIYLYKIYNVIEQNIEINLEGIKESIEIICELLIDNDSEAILSRIKEMKSEHGPFQATERDAYFAITGGREGYYIDLENHNNDLEVLDYLKSEKYNHGCFKCNNRPIIKKLLGEDLCENFFVLRCYECHQLKFINFLNEIVTGKEYSEIEGIEDILNQSSILSTHSMHREIKRIGIKEPFKETMDVSKYFYMGYKYYMNTHWGNSYHAFNEYLNSIGFYSVTEFLINNDRRKLKKCPFCNEFYIADDIRQKKCKNDNCKKAYQREKKRKQRETNPLKYV